MTGILATRIESQSEISNIKVTNSSLIHQSDSVGSIGTICGRLNNSKILNTVVQDCYIEGHNTVGGITGELQKNGYAENCLVKAEMYQKMKNKI